ncbi:aspartate--tRNA ligase [Planctomicrobium piriforme]|uniref:Aspartate--tRNA(Asp/Asn) ligase n=1 Tax=Planctomicrobium piriforme TaxID=1576369 RepID=A0A1I3F823_9PLAN|nr:aspartate--tRNA ligase [Planctomicrobium piriforme]SFI07357.1 aspartyl-tRNA synthetase [Planctomicrobium piriforme]
MLRTRTCGEIRIENVGQTVTLAGWVDRYRDHGGVVFIDLRDRYGITQVAFRLEESSDIQKLASGLRHEDVVQVIGEVVDRGPENKNPKLATGDVELRAAQLNVLNKSKTPPFEPRSDSVPNEELRLQYRYIDLRRPALQEKMILRHKLTKVVRDYFDENGFLEIETPILGRSTPEGARDYLVPSRVHEGTFYALPQSPQLFKQLLMVAGYDRYMQIARCFRDEDLRADRQPEFTQIDLEMAFVEQEDILQMVDGLVARMVHAVQGKDINLPLPRYTHAEVMRDYGSDKPDLRFGMKLKDISDLVAESDFGVFKNTVATGGKVRGICVKGCADKYSRRILDNDFKNIVGDYGAKGMAYFKVAGGKLESSIAKFFNEDQQKAIVRRMEAEDGDLLLYVADTWKVTCSALAALRNYLGRDLKLYDPLEINCAWVLDFPLVTFNAEENRWDAEHHPFCAVHPEDVGYFETDPSKIRAQSYDLVCNGYESASGSVRIHDSQIQQKIFDLLKIPAADAEVRFGFLLQALRYGAPPHAGIALGLDRWIMMFTGSDNIRDVIAFPKTQKASDLMLGAPSDVDAKQLRDLHIKIDVPK